MKNKTTWSFTIVKLQAIRQSRIAAILLCWIAALIFTACPSEPPHIAVTFSDVIANGNLSTTTTQLTLTFDKTITDLSAADITLSGVAGVSKGTLTGSGTTYTLPIFSFTSGGTLSVAVSKTGYNISGSPKNTTIFYSSNTTGADQLKADLEAAASGATVTITSYIEAQEDLTVPDGVTLEITGNGGLWLNNANLTVNGTVEAPSNRIGISAGDMTIDGSGTINLNSKGTLLSIGNGIKLTLDGVTLVGITDNDSPLVVVGEGGEFVLKSGAIKGNTNASGNGGGVRVAPNGTFTMEGGEISGNTAAGAGAGSGGGIFTNGTFTMSGGEISNNEAESGGGGVHISASGTFDMSGASKISGNKTGGIGGGVNIAGIFTMKGGEISGNKSSWAGGGVSLYRSGNSYGTLHIVTGTIYGSDADDENLRNTDNDNDSDGAALFKLKYEGVSEAVIEYGTFSGDVWNRVDDLDDTDDTVKVVDGALQL